MKKAAFLSLLLFMFFRSEAQVKTGSENFLLWRISGKDLSHPSYLFGTMHLTDKRLFNFGDSLYKAIENTQGFAAELDIKSAFTQYVNYLADDDNKEIVYIRSLLSKEFLKKNAGKLEDKFRKSVSEITLSDVEKAEKIRNTIMLRRGEMQTFMDAYLFDIADRQGKWTGGLEDPEDQFGLTDRYDMEDRIESLFEDRKNNKKSLEWMIKTYLDENLESIDKREELWKGAKSIVLFNRNVKMCRRIDSLLRIRTAFIAVGAAHLPGDSGMVSLLRGQGYTVTPVVSSKRIKPENYKFREVARSWVEVSMHDGAYKVEMPAAPEPFKAVSNTIIDMKFHFQMGTYTAYFSMAVPSNITSESVRDTMINKVVESYRSAATNFEEEEIMFKGLRGREIMFTNEFGEYKMQIFVPGNLVVVNAVFAMKRKELNNANSHKFFSSLKIDESNSSMKMGKSGWQQFDFPELAFSVSFPGKYKQKKEPVGEETWKRTSYDLIDIISQTYYSVTVDEAMDSYFHESDSQYFENTSYSLMDAMGGRLVSSKHKNQQGFPSYEMKLMSDVDGDSIMTEVQLVNRGNRRFLLLRVSDPNVSKLENDQFFSSFSLLPLKQGSWSNQSAPDNTFTAWAPGEFKTVESEDVGIEKSYSVYDKFSGASIFVQKDVLSPFFWTKNEESLFESKLRSYISYDSLLEKHAIRNGDHTGVEALIHVQGSHNLKQVRLLLNGDTLYSIYASYPREVKETEGFVRLFNSFRINNHAKGKELYQSKSKLLLEVLKTGDSAEFSEAKIFLPVAEFSTQDLPLLRSALLYRYRDFDSTYFYNANTNAILARVIEGMDTVDNATLSFIKDKFSSGVIKEELMPFFLSILSELRTSGSFELLRDILVKNPPKVSSYFPLNFRSNDSIELTKILFPDIIKIIDNEYLGPQILYTAIHLLDSNMLNADDIRKMKQPIVSNARKALGMTSDEIEVDSWTVANYPRLLSEINDDESRQLLAKFIEVENLRVKLSSVTGTLRIGKPVAKKHIDLLAKSDEFRYDLYSELKDLGKGNLLPAEFLNQTMLGKSFIYYLATDEDAPDNIISLGYRDIVFKGKEVRFQLYNVMFDEYDPESHYFGIAGPFDTNEKNFHSEMNASIINWEESYKKDKAEEMFKKLVERLEEE